MTSVSHRMSFVNPVHKNAEILVLKAPTDEQNESTEQTEQNEQKSGSPMHNLYQSRWQIVSSCRHRIWANFRAGETQKFDIWKLSKYPLFGMCRRITNRCDTCWQARLKDGQKHIPSHKNATNITATTTPLSPLSTTPPPTSLEDEWLFLLELVYLFSDRFYNLSRYSSVQVGLQSTTRSSKLQTSHWPPPHRP